MTTDAQDKKPVVIIYAPTASGKSALALKIAKEKNGVIINADSMQLYDVMHMLTAHPSAEEQAQAPHRLYGVLKPQEECSAQMWREMATEEINKAHANGQLPIVIGGTGFYLKALTEGLSPVPEVPPEIRAKIIALQKELGNPAFHADFATKDKVMTDRLHPNDTQRLIRAYEVFEATGKSLAEWQKLPTSGPPDDSWEFEYHFIDMPRDELYTRCEARFDIMIENGALDEVRHLTALIDDGIVPETALVTHALGFHPLRAYLRDEMSWEDAVDKSKQETRNYAKRQLTWLRNQIRAKNQA